MCYPDSKACETRQRKLDEIERVLFLKIKEIENKVSEVEREKKAITSLMEMQENWQLVRCE
jgi:hypothetical protein